MKPRDISVSVIEHGQETVRVWCCSFTLPGTIRQDGKINEGLRRKLEKQIAAILSHVEF